MRRDLRDEKPPGLTGFPNRVCRELIVSRHLYNTARLKLQESADNFFIDERFEAAEFRPWLETNDVHLGLCCSHDKRLRRT
jgi:hypothetical protein